jgi:hypothetical protein
MNQLEQIQLCRKALVGLVESEQRVIEELGTLEFVRASYRQGDPRRRQVEHAYAAAMLAHKHALFVARDVLVKIPSSS